MGGGGTKRGGGSFYKKFWGSFSTGEVLAILKGGCKKNHPLKGGGGSFTLS